MVKSSGRAVARVLLFVSAIAGCGTPDSGDGQKAQSEETTQKRSALTTSLFQPSVTFATGSNPEAVAIGDLDGDGRNDIALLTSFANDPANDYTVHVFLQDAAGNLKPRVKYPVGLKSTSIDIGDVNGDGRADVVVGLVDVTGAGVQIGVLAQNASGTLDPMVSHPAVNSFQVKVGDFNGDGRMDVAGICWGQKADGLDVLLQTESGALAAPVTYHVPHGGRDELDAGDIDGDGRTDLVVMSGQLAFPNLSVLLQTADGAFGAPSTYSVGGGVSTVGVALGDTSGDGRSDIVVSYGGNRPNAFIARFLQNAGGALDAAVPYASYDIPSAIAMADVDGDGRKDVLVTHSGFGRLGVYRQFPSGDFVNEELYTIPFASAYQPQGLAVGDVNGDALPDAVIADYLHGLVVLRHVLDVPLALAVTSPVNGSSSYTGVPLTVRWTVGDTVTLSGFDVSVSVNNGSTYTAIAGCTGLPATARDCPWTPTTAASGTRVRVTARDGGGQTASAETTFNAVRPSITLTAPGSTQFVGATSTISWFHNLPAGGTVRIELSHDGGSTWEVLADAAPNTNSFAWTVTGPSTGNARVRVTSNDSLPASGSTNNFAIVTPTLTVTAPAAGATVYSNALSVAWTNNVGTAATVRIELSRDGGSTFQTIAATASNVGTFSGSVTGPDSTDARVRVTTNGSVTASGTSASFTLATPAVAVTQPVAGAVLYEGAAVTIAWSTNLSASAPVLIEVARNGATIFQTVAANVPNTGSFTWIVTGPPGTGAVRVTVGGTGSTTATATSGTFAVTTPTLAIASPFDGATVYAGVPLTITWSTSLPSASPVSIELSRDGGSTFETLTAAAPNTGNFTWVATGPDTATARVRVSVSDPLVMAATSGSFAILTPRVTVTGPAGGTLAYAGTPVTITWTHNLADLRPMSIELSRNGGVTFESLAIVAQDTNSFVWIASGPDTAEARVRVSSTGFIPASDVGPAFQVVTPTVAVTSPAAGASWAIGTARTISWTSNLPGGATVGVALSRDGGATWTALASAAPASGSLPWTATAPATTNALVRVSADGGLSAVGTSGTFAIGSPALAVTSPVAGAKWTIGTAQAITWSTNLLPTATVKVQLSRNGGSTFTNLATAAPNTGSFAWTATGSATTTAIVRITANGFTATGTSGVFTLAAGSVTVTSPNTAVTWTIGTVHAITWNHNAGAGAQFQIEVSRSGVWSVITAAAPAASATTGSYAWTVTGAKTTNAKIRVTWTANTAAKDTSDVAFKIN